MKTPSFYRHKPHEIERAFLTYVPEAPRVSPDVATDWEALSDDSGDGKVGISRGFYQGAVEDNLMVFCIWIFLICL